MGTSQQITISTHAGTGIEGFVDGDALTQAQFSFPIGVGTCVGNDGAVYVADRGNHAVRKIFNGQVTTLAGNGIQGYADGVGSVARFAFPNALTVDDTNNVYVADWLNSLIRKITPAGVVTTYAGTPGQNGYQDGPGSTARFFAPFGLTIDTAGNLYVSEANNVIRKIAPDRTVTTYAGLYIFGQGGYLDGPANTARFDRPSGLAFDDAGNLYVAEEGNHTIRKISSSLIVSTVAGVNHIGTGPANGGYIDGDALTQAEFNTPSGITIGTDGNVYVADEYNHRIRKITQAGIVSTFAGSGPFGTGNGGFAEGPADSARFNQPYSICHDANNNFYIADLNNHRIRKISGLPLVCNLQTSFIITDESCIGAEDGAIDLTVSNGTPLYSFQWSSGLTIEDLSNLPAGGYFVIVTDSNNCTATGTAVVNTIPPDSATSANLSPPCSELFISEYTEGQAHNRAIEIYNPSNDTMALNRYFLRIFMNGAPTPLIAQLVGILLPNKTHVIAHPNASSPIYSLAQQTSNKLTFDGDDALQLIKVKNTFIPNIDSIEGIGGNPHAIFDTLDLDTIDQLGIPFVDPGNQGFPAGSGTTKNSTLIRNASVTYGQTDWGCGQKQWKVLSQDSVADLGKHNSNCKKLAQMEIFFSFTNPAQTTDTASGTNYFEFDVTVSANVDSTWLSQAIFKVGYNANAFIFNDITVMLGDSFSIADHYISNNKISDSVCQILISNTTNANRTLIPAIPTQLVLVHIKIKITNCNQYTRIHFTDTVTTSNSYAFSPDGLSTAPYDKSHFGEEMNLKLCELNIFDFFPNPIAAGTGSVLTIQGIGFGSTRGNNGQVGFKNADDWGQTFISLDSIDYLSWNDNEIQINFPANVAVAGSVINTPGNGFFYIITDSGDSLMSNDSLLISYARDTWPLPNGFSEPFGKLKVHLGTVRIADSSTYVYYIDTSIANNPMVFAIVKKAMRDWGCETGINFTIGGIVQNQNFNADTISIIYLDNNLHGDPVAGTRRAKRVCYQNYVTANADIQISRDLSGIPTLWWFDTVSTSVPPNSLDFYEVILHELGHAHGLDHVLNSEEIMYTGHSPGPIPGIGRVSIKSASAPYDSPNSKIGAREVITESEGIIIDTTCIGFDSTLVHYLCKGFQSVIWYDNSGFSFQIYPNPNVDNKLFISYVVSVKSQFSIKLIDVLGREVFNIYEGETKPGRYNYTVNISDINPGIYLLMVIVNKEKYLQKIIKQ